MTLARAMTLLAIAIVVGWIGWALYEKFAIDTQPGDLVVASAHTSFGDGDFARAEARYQEALGIVPERVEAWIGLANARRMREDLDGALEALNRAVELEPDLSVAYANRGIVQDLMGRHERALADYETALRLDREAKALDGPGLITRFLRNQPEPPPSVADRAAYLRAQFELPPEERVLRDPERDAEQRPYKVGRDELTGAAGG